MTRQAIHVAYSVSMKFGRNYHAVAYCEESGFPGLPDNHLFRSATGVGNDDKSSGEAMRQAIAALIRQYPEYSGVQVFSHGRISDSIVNAGGIIGFHGRNYCIGVASELAG